MLKIVNFDQLKYCTKLYNKKYFDPPNPVSMSDLTT